MLLWSIGCEMGRAAGVPGNGRSLGAHRDFKFVDFLVFGGLGWMGVLVFFI